MKKISNLLFILAIISGIYGGSKIIYNRITLPSGACPVGDNRPYLYLTIGLVIASIVLDVLIKLGHKMKVDKKKKKEIDAFYEQHKNKRK